VTSQDKTAKPVAKAKAGEKKDAPKAPRRQKNPQERFDFIVSNLNNREDYFRLSFGLEFLLDIFNVLIETEKVSKADIERFVQSTHSSKSLKEIFEHFKLKQA